MSLSGTVHTSIDIAKHHYSLVLSLTLQVTSTSYKLISTTVTDVVKTLEDHFGLCYTKRLWLNTTASKRILQNIKVRIVADRLDIRIHIQFIVILIPASIHHHMTSRWWYNINQTNSFNWPLNISNHSTSMFILYHCIKDFNILTAFRSYFSDLSSLNFGYLLII